MKAIILAAGRGSRLNELTSEKPKCLNIIGGQSLIKWQISVLRAGGVDEIIIVTGYRAEMLEFDGIKTVCNHDWEKTQMVSSLLCAREEFEDGVIVSYSDIIYSSSVVSSLIKKKEDGIVVFDTKWRELWESRFDKPLEDAESFRINEDGLIEDIGQSVASFDDVQGQFVGLMKFPPIILSWIIDMNDRYPDKIRRTDMTTLLQMMVKEGRKLYGMAINGGWCEVDTARDLAVAEKLYFEGALKIE